MRPAYKAALCFALISLGLGACHGQVEKTSQATFKEEVIPVTLSQIDDTKPVAATLTTRKLSEATARISGLLISLRVREGDAVKQGQVIGQIRTIRSIYKPEPMSRPRQRPKLRPSMPEPP